jgi:predicted nuclease of predicted toxin-antitoxin system
MARLLVDMNLSTEWIPFLKAAGHEAVHWSEVGDPRAPDTEQMTWASARGYAVFGGKPDGDCLYGDRGRHHHRGRPYASA